MAILAAAGVATLGGALALARRATLVPAARGAGAVSVAARASGRAAGSRAPDRGRSRRRRPRRADVPTSDANDTPDTAQGPLSEGVTYTGATDSAIDDDWFTFAVGAGAHRVVVSLSQPARGTCALPDDGAFVELYGPSADDSPPLARRQRRRDGRAAADHQHAGRAGDLLPGRRHRLRPGAPWALRIDAAGAAVAPGALGGRGPVGPSQAPAEQLAGAGAQPGAHGSACRRAKRSQTRWAAAVAATPARPAPRQGPGHRRLARRLLALQRSTLGAARASGACGARAAPPLPRGRGSRRTPVSWPAMPAPLKITILEGDETGQELLEQALRVLAPDVIGLELDARPATTSRSSGAARRDNEVVARGRARRCARPASGIKAATITPEGADDVGSPNRIVREGVDGKVIVRTGRRIPASRRSPAPTTRSRWSAWRSRTPTAPSSGARASRGRAGRAVPSAPRRSPARPATRSPSTPSAPRSKMGGKVYGGPKWTVSPVYEGMLKEEMDAAAARYPDVAYRPILIDATYAGLISGSSDDAAGHPGAQPRRRLPVGPRHADVRLDRRRRVGAAGLRRRLPHDGRDGRGAARHGARAAGQGRRQPDGDDPELRARSCTTRPRPGTPAPSARRARSTSPSWRPRPPASAPPTSAATPAPRSSPTTSSGACGPRSTSGPRWARRSEPRAAGRAARRAIARAAARRPARCGAGARAGGAVAQPLRGERQRPGDEQGPRG